MKMPLFTRGSWSSAWAEQWDHQRSERGMRILESWRWVSPHLMGDMWTISRQNFMPVWIGNERDDASFHTTSTKHHKDNEHSHLNLRKDVQTVFNAIPRNPSQLDSLCNVNDITYTFPESVVETIKIVLSEEETQVKSFISDHLILKKTPITAKIKKKKKFFAETWRHKHCSRS